MVFTETNRQRKQYLTPPSWELKYYSHSGQNISKKPAPNRKKRDIKKRQILENLWLASTAKYFDNIFISN